MQKRKWEKAPQRLVELFYSVMNAFPDAELRKMFGYPCAFYNGNMFTGLHESNLIVRLDVDELEKAFMAKLGTRFEPMQGRIMKEYLALSQEVLNDHNQVASFIEKSLNFVKTLPKKEKKKRRK